MKILIDNSHGIQTKGKRSPDGKLLEYAYTRDFARQIVTTLKARGYDSELLVPEASVSDGLLAHSLETKPIQQPVEIQTKIVYRDSVIFKDVVVHETVEVEKELTGWQSFKMKMGGWFL